MINIADNVAVSGVMEEHDENLIQLMERAKAKGLVFNSSKCNIKTDKKSQMNTACSPGVKPYPEKIEAILQVPPPDKKDKVQRFLVS